MNSEKYPHRQETYQILGAAMEVYREKGCGFLEGVYQECLVIELGLQQIPFSAKHTIRLTYKGHPLQHVYEPDFLCFDKVVVEIKAVGELGDEHRAQVINYLNATGFDVALLINFGHHPGLEYERFANTRNKVAARRVPLEGK
jgi:GxxExxY protein